MTGRRRRRRRSSLRQNFRHSARGSKTQIPRSNRTVLLKALGGPRTCSTYCIDSTLLRRVCRAFSRCVRAIPRLHLFRLSFSRSTNFDPSRRAMGHLFTGDEIYEIEFLRIKARVQEFLNKVGACNNIDTDFFMALFIPSEQKSMIHSITSFDLKFLFQMLIRHWFATTC